MTIELFLQLVLDISKGIKQIEENQKQIFKQLAKIEDSIWETKKEELNSLFLNEKEVCKILGRSIRWLIEQRKLGEISWIQVGSRKVMFERAEIERYLRDRTIKRL